ncbi:hypothetical protein T552_02517 [Pneumocystis carinii B80]|uniref:Mitochondrial import inner membrane translocase subunit TIM54 n=1 Tax=Pneumocystis carinii (strain B80) TaxID=1408658 RepID=A0A0W4ZF78_PNEC8|nr:hypothetical protein T552_02517 [Pneumocystis carinii B80]KTW27024.1 hypothetical protein T552_02517 [Pneumocystis carinii B80]
MNNLSRVIFGFPRISHIKTFKRPSKPWIVFFLSFFTFSGLVIYDKKEKDKVIEKYCNKVKFLSEKPMDPLELPRKVKIYMSLPPGNDIWMIQNYFQEYIRPILQAGAVDYEIIQGNKEGYLQRQVSEEILQYRRGESGLSPEMHKVMTNVRPSTEESSAIIIGRHSLKEYLAGIHDGWLEMLESPSVLSDSSKTSVNILKESVSSVLSKKKSDSNFTDDITIPTLQFIPYPYVLGFFNMHIRIYRFLNRRFLAQSIASKTVDILLSNNTRLWSDNDKYLGEDECHGWPKQYKTRTTSGVWTDDFPLDKRIMSHVHLYC